MTSSIAPQSHVKVNFNDREYEFSELPPNAQMILQDMVRLDQQIGQLQFELRHLQAAREVYGRSLGKTMNEEAASHEHSGESDNAEDCYEVD